MKFQQLGILCASILCFVQVVENAINYQALRECGIKQHPSSNGSFYNSRCTLLCVLENDTMIAEPINEGKSCPEDTLGICHKGECIGGVDDALNQCRERHSLEFRKMKYHTGTAFTNDHCMLKCVISGKEWSANHLHEGSSCPTNLSGVCRAGACVDKTTTAPTPTTSLPTTIGTIQPTKAPSNRLLQECANIHHIDIDKFPTSSAMYGNKQCTLECVIGNDTLPVDHINEGKPCPEDTTGTCLKGVCIGQENAVSSCLNIHGNGFYGGDMKGTGFSNDHCMLKCESIVKDRLRPLVVWMYNSDNNMHEGSPCPINASGICHKGVCVAPSTILGSTVTPTPVPPTKVTHPSVVEFSLSKMKLLNISLESAVPSLRQKETIDLNYFSINKKVPYYRICTFHGNPTQQNDYDYGNMHHIASDLNWESSLWLTLHSKDAFVIGQHTIYLNSLFKLFYQNRKLAFGQQEKFVSGIIPVSRIEPPYDSLLEVALSFTIVVSE